MARISPLYRRDFRLLWMGMSVSLIGDGIFVVAIAWQAYALSNQPSSLAYVGLANALPQIALLLVGGAVSDRSDRRRVLALADIVRAAAVGIFALVTAVATPRLWDLIAIAGIIGTATAFASPSLDALVPQLLPPDELTQANALDQAVRPSRAPRWADWWLPSCGPPVPSPSTP
jgi:MFS family permease